MEEQRLDDRLTPTGPEVGPELVRLGGFDDDVSRFTTRLCEPVSRSQALQLTLTSGTELWRAAVQRAQSPQTWDAFDDRPLHWARLHATKALRQWQPRGWQLTATDRAKLVDSFDRASRGVSDLRFSDGVRRVAVTGFDPFQLSGTSVRRSNPASAAALQLDGEVIDTPAGAGRGGGGRAAVLWGRSTRGSSSGSTARRSASGRTRWSPPARAGRGGSTSSGGPRGGGAGSRTTTTCRRAVWRRTRPGGLNRRTSSSRPRCRTSA
ncbi:hypothetical protein ALI22I_39540 [Saccharothrix sp. ALI-22-I]|uniref:hypothetical protein n=1 Tax=Saccharothrix sp. ALI-22-I TaxID=1933778 RepID=UPI00097BAA36|nr:hypothetical protein [Saccharothrix sp. ALI-22-I]ONI82229.1 hypothetical protein ALI22I_39540 [Saccharothrix sp. ALI-22-I]